MENQYIIVHSGDAIVDVRGSAFSREAEGRTAGKGDRSELSADPTSPGPGRSCPTRTHTRPPASGAGLVGWTWPPPSPVGHQGHETTFLLGVCPMHPVQALLQSGAGSPNYFYKGLRRGAASSPLPQGSEFR